jgi:hypothetical protein
MATNRWGCAVLSGTQQCALNIAAQFGRDIAIEYVVFCYIMLRVIQLCRPKLRLFSVRKGEFISSY